MYSEGLILRLLYTGLQPAATLIGTDPHRAQPVLVSGCCGSWANLPLAGAFGTTAVTYTAFDGYVSQVGPSLADLSFHF